MTQKDLFGGVPAQPPKARVYVLKKKDPPPPPPEPAPAREEPPPARGSFDIKAHLAAGRAAAPGTRYCFEHEKWEYGVGMWLDVKRWVFYCEAAGRERGAKKYTGNPKKPTED